MSLMFELDAMHLERPFARRGSGEEEGGGGRGRERCEIQDSSPFRRENMRITDGMELSRCKRRMINYLKRS